MTSVSAIKLWFSQAPELSVTSVRLTGEGDRIVTLAALTRARENGSPLVATVQGTMEPGRYTTRWRTMSRDGHPISGSFSFTLAPAGTPTHQH